MKITELKNIIVSSLLSINLPYKLEVNTNMFTKNIVLPVDVLEPIIDKIITDNLAPISELLGEADTIMKEKKSLQSEKELFEIEADKLKTSLSMKYELGIEDIKKQLKLDDNEKTKQLGNALLEIENLKNQITFYKEQNNEYRDLMKEGYKSNNEALIKVAESKNNIIVK